MKLRSFFALIVSASMLFACSESSEEVTPDDSDSSDSSVTATGISLDQTSATMEIGGYFTLVASLEPTGATGTISWVSSNSSVVAVSDGGTVVAVAAGTANVVASCGSLSATCVITVNEAGLHESLQGSNYYLISLDYITYDEVASNVVADLRPDDVNSFLYIWAGYNAGTSSGVNAYGQTESWTCLTVESSSGWSGYGIYVGANGDYTGINELHTTTDNPSDYYLHVALKSSVAVSHAIKLEGVGSGLCVIGNNGQIESRDPDYTLTSDGEWQHFDIPMTHFTNQGFAFSPEYTDATNVFIVLSGAVDGSPLDIDAVFFYKK